MERCALGIIEYITGNHFVGANGLGTKFPVNVLPAEVSA